MLKLGRVLLFLAAHAAFADAWTPRAAAFREKQAAERKRLGLDGAKTARAYPTPEVFFGSSWACPGETSTVLLEGKLQPGSMGSQRVEKAQALMAVQQGAAQNIQAAMTPTVGCKSLTGTIEGQEAQGRREHLRGHEALRARAVHRRDSVITPGK